MRLMEHTARARLLAFALCAAVLAGLGAGCSPGSSSDTSVSASDEQAVDPAKLGDVTITEWDKNTDGASNRWMNQLNDRFESLYPNITIDRVARSFDDLKRTLKLALSSGSPPDVVQVNQGYGDLGAFAAAGLLRPIDGYAKDYGWEDSYPPTLLNQNRSTSSGGWGSGNLYGVSSAAEIVGVYYNNEQLRQLGLKPPTTWDEFVADLEKAKAGGLLPLQYGNADQVQGIHLLGVILANLAGPETVNDLVYGREGASWEDPKVVEALQTMADWAEKGYIPSDANGVSQDRALANFEDGQGVFFNSGSWYGGDLAALGTGKVGFNALIPPGATEPVAMGGLGLPWAIPAGAKEADAAAAYIDFLTSPEAAEIIAKTGELTARSSGYRPPPGTVTEDLTSAMQKVMAADTMVPYLDYSTTNFFTVLGSQLQQLTAGQSSPEEVASALQSELESFKASQ